MLSLHQKLTLIDYMRPYAPDKGIAFATAAAVEESGADLSDLPDNVYLGAMRQGGITMHLHRMPAPEVKIDDIKRNKDEGLER